MRVSMLSGHFVRLLMILGLVFCSSLHDPGVAQEVSEPHPTISLINAVQSWDSTESDEVLGYVKEVLDSVDDGQRASRSEYHPTGRGVRQLVPADAAQLLESATTQRSLDFEKTGAVNLTLLNRQALRLALAIRVRVASLPAKEDGNWWKTPEGYQNALKDLRQWAKQIRPAPDPENEAVPPGAVEAIYVAARAGYLLKHPWQDDRTDSAGFDLLWRDVAVPIVLQSSLYSDVTRIDDALTRLKEDGHNTVVLWLQDWLDKQYLRRPPGGSAEASPYFAFGQGIPDSRDAAGRQPTATHPLVLTLLSDRLAEDDKKLPRIKDIDLSKKLKELGETDEDKHEAVWRETFGEEESAEDYSKFLDWLLEQMYWHPVTAANIGWLVHRVPKRLDRTKEFDEKAFDLLFPYDDMPDDARKLVKKTGTEKYWNGDGHTRFGNLYENLGERVGGKPQEQGDDSDKDAIGDRQDGSGLTTLTEDSPKAVGKLSDEFSTKLEAYAKRSNEIGKSLFANCPGKPLWYEVGPDQGDLSKLLKASVGANDGEGEQDPSSLRAARADVVRLLRHYYALPALDKASKGHDIPEWVFEYLRSQAEKLQGKEAKLSSYKATAENVKDLSAEDVLQDWAKLDNWEGVRGSGNTLFGMDSDPVIHLLVDIHEDNDAPGFEMLTVEQLLTLAACGQLSGQLSGKLRVFAKKCIDLINNEGGTVWKTRAGLQGLILLSRLAYLTGDPFVAGQVLNVEDECKDKLGSWIKLSLEAIEGKKTSQISILPLVYAAQSLACLFADESLGLPVSSYCSWLDNVGEPKKEERLANANEFLDQICTQIVAKGPTAAMAAFSPNGGGQGARFVMAMLAEIQLARFRWDRQLSIEPLGKAFVKESNKKVWSSSDAISEAVTWDGRLKLQYANLLQLLKVLRTVASHEYLDYAAGKPSESFPYSDIWWEPAWQVNHMNRTAGRNAEAVGEAKDEDEDPLLLPWLNVPGTQARQRLHDKLAYLCSAIQAEAGDEHDIDNRGPYALPRRTWAAVKAAVEKSNGVVKNARETYRAKVKEQDEEAREDYVKGLLEAPNQLATADHQEQIEVAIAEVAAAEAELDAAEHALIAGQLRSAAAIIQTEIEKLEEERVGLHAQYVKLDTEIATVGRRIAEIDEKLAKAGVDEAELRKKQASLMSKKAGLKVEQIQLGIDYLEKQKALIQKLILDDVDENGKLKGTEGAQTYKGLLGLKLHQVAEQVGVMLDKQAEQFKQAADAARAEENKSFWAKLIEGICRFAGAVLGAIFGGPAGAKLGWDLGGIVGEIAAGAIEGKEFGDILLGLVDNVVDTAANVDVDIGNKLKEASAVFEAVRNGDTQALLDVPFVSDLAKSVTDKADELWSELRDVLPQEIPASVARDFLEGTKSRLENLFPDAQDLDAFVDKLKEQLEGGSVDLEAFWKTGKLSDEIEGALDDAFKGAPDLKALFERFTDPTDKDFEKGFVAFLRIDLLARGHELLQLVAQNQADELTAAYMEWKGHEAISSTLSKAAESYSGEIVQLAKYAQLYFIEPDSASSWSALLALKGEDVEGLREKYTSLFTRELGLKDIEANEAFTKWKETLSGQTLGANEVFKTLASELNAVPKETLEKVCGQLGNGVKKIDAQVAIVKALLADTARHLSAEVSSARKDMWKEFSDSLPKTLTSSGAVGGASTENSLLLDPAEALRARIAVLTQRYQAAMSNLTTSVSGKLDGLAKDEADTTPRSTKYDNLATKTKTVAKEFSKAVNSRGSGFFGNEEAELKSERDNLVAQYTELVQELNIKACDLQMACIDVEIKAIDEKLEDKEFESALLGLDKKLASTVIADLEVEKAGLMTAIASLEESKAAKSVKEADLRKKATFADVENLKALHRARAADLNAAKARLDAARNRGAEASRIRHMLSLPPVRAPEPEDWFGLRKQIYDAKLQACKDYRDALRFARAWNGWQNSEVNHNAVSKRSLDMFDGQREFSEQKIAEVTLARGMFYEEVAYLWGEKEELTNEDYLIARWLFQIFYERDDGAWTCWIDDDWTKDDRKKLTTQCQALIERLALTADSADLANRVLDIVDLDNGKSISPEEANLFSSASVMMLSLDEVLPVTDRAVGGEAEETIGFGPNAALWKGCLCKKWYASRDGQVRQDEWPISASFRTMDANANDQLEHSEWRPSEWEALLATTSQEWPQWSYDITLLPADENFFKPLLGRQNWAYSREGGAGRFMAELSAEEVNTGLISLFSLQTSEYDGQGEGEDAVDVGDIDQFMVSHRGPLVLGRRDENGEEWEWEWVRVHEYGGMERIELDKAVKLRIGATTQDGPLTRALVANGEFALAVKLTDKVKDGGLGFSSHTRQARSFSLKELKIGLWGDHFKKN